MDILPEVIIFSSDSCSIRDSKTGKNIESFGIQDPRNKDITISPKTLSLIGQDFLIGACSSLPMLKIINFETKEVKNIVVPGIVSALAVSNCGKYCIAGIKEQIFVWEVTTGELLMVLSRHYQSLTCLKFTVEDSYFFSGGKDGHVLVWILSDVIDVNGYPDNIKPQFVWNKHSAEVTDIYCGSQMSRVATTSLDMTCKIYELETGMLLSSICMDVPLTSVVMDPLEYIIFLGDEQGHVYKINTYERLPHEIHRADINNKVALKLHESKIISLSISINGKQLMTVSEDQTCKLWDIHSMACVGSSGFEVPVTNAFLAIKPIHFFNIEDKNKPKTLLSYQMFDREFSKKTDKKYIEARISHKELSIMYDGCPDNYYGHSIFCCKPGSKVETLDAAAVEDVFQEKIHGETISDMTGVNQQLFAFTLNSNLQTVFEAPPSPS